MELLAGGNFLILNNILKSNQLWVKVMELLKLQFVFSVRLTNITIYSCNCNM